MTDDDSKLVDIFMEAQARPIGRSFSENILAGIRAVLAYRSSEADQRDAALQAKIDALMLEYCPEEMTREQVANWKASQTVSDGRMGPAARERDHLDPPRDD